jgi:hypothetical protein
MELMLWVVAVLVVVLSVLHFAEDVTEFGAIFLGRARRVVEGLRRLKNEWDGLIKSSRQPRTERSTNDRTKDDAAQS